LNKILKISDDEVGPNWRISRDADGEVTCDVVGVILAATIRVNEPPWTKPDTRTKPPPSSTSTVAVFFLCLIV